MRPPCAMLAVLVLAQPLAAQSQPDSRPVVRRWEAATALGLTAITMALDGRVRGVLRRGTKQLPSTLVRTGDLFGNVRYVLPPLMLGTWTGRALGDDGLEGVSRRALESAVLSGVTDLVLKSAIGRRRPDIKPNTPYSFRPFAFKGNSFPSGHTAIAFALATSLASETRDHWSDALFFGAGTLTAFARINDDKHWLSDTVFGAAVGIVSARLVRHWHAKKSSAGVPFVSLSFSF